jgi:hypothetical protein
VTGDREQGIGNRGENYILLPSSSFFFLLPELLNS